jgi:peroxiredoxin
MDFQNTVKNNLRAPDFTLPDLRGDLYSPADYTGRIVILNFWSAECPWSSRVDQQIAELLQKWENAVQYFPIASNMNESLELITREASARELPIILHDNNLQVADLYGALTTPHFFVIDAEGILRYQGAFDDVTFRQRTPTINYLPQAVEAIQSGLQPEPAETPPYGCSVVRVMP